MDWISPSMSDAYPVAACGSFVRHGIHDDPCVDRGISRYLWNDDDESVYSLLPSYLGTRILHWDREQSSVHSECYGVCHSLSSTEGTCPRHLVGGKQSGKHHLSYCLQPNRAGHRIRLCISGHGIPGSRHLCHIACGDTPRIWHKRDPPIVTASCIS